jgi:hypothetical protein
MRMTSAAFVASLVALSAAACAPSLNASGERGVTIDQSEARILSGESDAAASATATKYCNQFGRVPHLESERMSWFWSATFTYQCV